LIYADTSVLAAYYCPEPLSERAQQALLAAQEPAISWLVEVELASALSRKVRNRAMRAADAHQSLAAFESHLEQGLYVRLPVHAGHFAKAREWLATFALPLQTLDAVHLAVAAIQGCPILTADVSLAKTCTKIGITVQLIKLSTGVRLSAGELPRALKVAQVCAAQRS